MPVEKKDTASAIKTQPVKPQPTIDPKVWDFLPETVAVIGDRKISKQEYKEMYENIVLYLQVLF